MKPEKKGEEIKRRQDCRRDKFGRWDPRWGITQGKAIKRCRRGRPNFRRCGEAVSSFAMSERDKLSRSASSPVLRPATTGSGWEERRILWLYVRRRSNLTPWHTARQELVHLSSTREQWYICFEKRNHVTLLHGHDGYKRINPFCRSEFATSRSHRMKCSG